MVYSVQHYRLYASSNLHTESVITTQTCKQLQLTRINVRYERPIADSDNNVSCTVSF